MVYFWVCSGIFLASAFLGGYHSGWGLAMYEEFDLASSGKISHTAPHIYLQPIFTNLEQRRRNIGDIRLNISL